LARAYSIWVVSYSYPDPDLILGAFTVKHELITWLKKQTDPTRFLIKRVYDGNLKYQGIPEYIREPEIITAIDLLRGG